jgi:hypothetical protein
MLGISVAFLIAIVAIVANFYPMLWATIPLIGLVFVALGLKKSTSARGSRFFASITMTVCLSASFITVVLSLKSAMG